MLLSDGFDDGGMGTLFGLFCSRGGKRLREFRTIFMSYLNERFAGFDLGDKVADLADAPLSDGDGLRGTRVRAIAARRIADGGPRRPLLLGDHPLVDDATTNMILKVNSKKHLNSIPKFIQYNVNLSCLQLSSCPKTKFSLNLVNP